MTSSRNGSRLTGPGWHDMFAVPFDDIAAIIGRSPAAARQLASRARRRVRGVAIVPAASPRPTWPSQSGKACRSRTAISFSTRGPGSGWPMSKRSAPDEVE
jgi:hypothetical protein